jgi:glycosyltransferase involved in cell wall biosynthesis
MVDMKNVLYLTWCENIVDYGIFESQVFRKLEYLSKSSAYKFFVLSGIPVGKKFLSDSTSYQQKLYNIKQRFSSLGILFSHRNIIKISPHFHAPWWAVWSLHFPHILFFKRYIERHQIDLVHCRSYHSALLALLTRAVFHMKYKVLFDTRGLVAEEGVLIGAYAEGSLSYRFWRFIEKHLLDASDAVVNVSDNFTEHVKQISCNSNMHTIFTGVDTSVFASDLEKRDRVGRQLGIAENVKVLAYSGSLGEKGWHSPVLLAEVYSAFKSCFADTRLLIISTSDPQIIAAGLEKHGLSEHDYMIVAGKTLDDVSHFLQRGDYAVFSYREIHGRIEEAISRTVIAIKTGEYLACGLPLIVNKYAGAAANLVEKNGVGVVFNPGSAESIIDGVACIEREYAAVALKCREVALEYFDYEKNSQKYVGIYRDLLA